MLSIELHISGIECGVGWAPEVDGLVGEQAVGVGGVQQRQRQRRRVRGVLGEAVRAHAGPQARLAVRAAQHQPLHAQRLRRLTLQDQLQGELTVLYALVSASTRHRLPGGLACYPVSITFIRLERNPVCVRRMLTQ